MASGGGAVPGRAEMRRPFATFLQRGMADITTRAERMAAW